MCFFLLFQLKSLPLQPKITNNEDETYKKGGSHDARRTCNRLM